MRNPVWRLDEDLSVHDNALDGFTFDSLITAVRCNSRVIDEDAVRKAKNDILGPLLQDMEYLIELNMDLIIKLAKKGRADYED